MLSLFKRDDPAGRVADWLEGELLLTGRTSVSEADLLTAANIEFDDLPSRAGDEDVEIEEPTRNQLSDSVWNELSYRASALGPLYPMELNSNPNGSWVLTRRLPTGESPLRAAHQTYDAALCIAIVRSHYIAIDQSEQQKLRQLKEIEKGVANGFQSIAYLSLHGLSPDMQVLSFGWPRNKRDDYQSALQGFVRRIELGTLMNPPPARRTGKEKDGSVDLIAWRHFGDGLPGFPVLYGQVASGNNWLTKPITSFLKEKFLDWFCETPSEHHMHSLMMPFTLTRDLRLDTDADPAYMLRSVARGWESTYGLLLDRIRLTELAYNSTHNRSGVVDRREHIRTILAWRSAVRRLIDSLG